jgi:hypothetical protein
MAYMIVQGFTVAVAVAGTPVPVKSVSFGVRQFTIQSIPTNAGTYMIIKDAAGNIMAKITKGQSFTPPQPNLGQGFDLNTIQVDSDTNGDGVYVAIAL